MSSLRLSLLGAPRLERSGEHVDIRRRKGLALLAYLATTRKPHNRDALATLLWPNSDQAGARANLRRDLSRLQKDVGEDVLETEQDQIAFNESALTVDVVAFRRALAAVDEHDHAAGHLCDDCRSRLETAISLYKGEFLEGFTVPDSAAFEEWLLFQAERLRRAYGRALQQLLQWHAAQEAYEQALSYAHSWLALDPLNESAQRQIMRLYAWAGETAAALRQYRECARILEEELGVSPAQETTALYEAIRSQSLPPPSQASADSLPTPGESAMATLSPTPEIGLDIPLVGRQAELKQLNNALNEATEGRGQTILLEGEPGIGKSRLVQEVAQQAAEQNVNLLLGKCYQGQASMPYQIVIELLDQILVNWPAAFRQLSPPALAELALLVPELTTLFPDLPPLPTGLDEARQARLLRTITRLFTIVAAGKGLMVVVDDLQWTDPVSRLFLQHLARQLSREPILLIVTFRSEEVAADEELSAYVHSLQRERRVQHISLARLSGDDARALVRHLTTDPANAEMLGRWLHQETDGNPFFLISILQSLLEQGLWAEAGTQGRRLDAERLQSAGADLTLPDALREAIRARLLRLPRAVRPLLDVAAVYGRRFDFDILQAISGESSSSLLDLLEELLLRQLLREEEGGRYYDFSHDKIREVVYYSLSGARRRLLHRIIAETLEERGSESAATLAGHFEAAQIGDRAVHYLGRAALRAHDLFAIREALGFYDRALALAESDEQAADDNTLVDLYKQRGETRALAGDFDGAVEDLQRALALVRVVDDEAAQRTLLAQLGMTYRRADNYDRARPVLERALALARAANDPHGVADALFHLGTVIWTEGDNRDSIPYQKEAVEICRRKGFSDLVAVQATHGRGETFFLAGYYEEAKTYLSESLALSRQIGDRAYEAENLYMLGAINSALLGAHYEQARDALEEALEISRAAQMDWHVVPPLFILGDVLGSLGQYGAALEHAREAVQLADRLGIIYFKSMALDYLGSLYRDLNLLDKAVAAHSQGQEEAAGGHAGNWLPRIQANLAIDRLRQGQMDVDDALQGALQTCIERSQELHGARCLEGLAEWAVAAGEPGLALDYTHRLQEMAAPRGMRERLVRAYQWRGTALLHLEREEEAEDCLQQSLAMAETMGAPCVLRKVHRALAALYEQRGQEDVYKQHDDADRRLTAQIADSLTHTTPDEGAVQ
jgi:predicted ATPase/DNA-binding SARP family transcriptional activator